MQIPSGGPVPNGQSVPGSWNPTRQQLDQLETILQKMIKNPGTGDQNTTQTLTQPPYWAGSPLNPPSNMNNWSQPQNPTPQSPHNLQSYQQPNVPEANSSIPAASWNPSQTTWGPLAETWRNQQAPFSQPVSANPARIAQEPQSPGRHQPAPIPSTPVPKQLSSPANFDDYGETGISWLLNAAIDLPLRFMGPPGRFFMSWGGRYLLGFVGIAMVTYSGILVASDWMEWPWADRLIPSNLIQNILPKAG